MLNRVKRIIRYRDWSIRLKLLAISILLTFCSAFMISFISFKQYTMDFQQQSSDRIQQTIEQVSLNLNTYLDDLFRLSLSPYYKRDVMAAVKSDNIGSASEQLDKSRLIEDFLNEMMITPRNDIIRVFIFTLSNNIYIGSRISANIDSKVDFHDFEWYREALKKREPVFVPVHLEEIVGNPKKMVFSIVNQLRDTQDPSIITGVIKVDANYSGIQSICGKVKMGEMGRLYIIDENKNIIYPENLSSTDLDSDTRNILFADNRDILSADSGSGKSTYTANPKQGNYLVNTANVASSNWTVVAVNPLSELNRAAAKTRDMSFFLAFLFSLLTTLVFIIFYKRFLNPLISIVRLMKEVQNGNLSVKYVQKSNDEIGYLGASFNSMLSRINEMLAENTSLVKQVYEYRLLQKEAQFSALYSQIKPHFIYNALNMISLSMQCGKYKNAISNINMLSRLLRGLTNMNREIPLELELSFLDSYLGIQSGRYEEKLEYSINISRDLYSYHIPAFLLQPIVENSIVHGCEERKEKTAIKIYSACEDESIVIYIEDDGPGIPEEKLLQLRMKMDCPDEEGYQPETDGKNNAVGLVNVNKRIKLKYGEKYGLYIYSRIGGGTLVKIRLPAADIPLAGIKEAADHV